MRNCLCGAALFLVLLAAVSVSAQAQAEDEVRAKLKYIDMPNVEHPLIDASQAFANCMPEKPVDFGDVPETLSDTAVYAQAYGFDGMEGLAMVVDGARLLVDTDADGSLRDESFIEATPNPSRIFGQPGQWWGPFDVKVGTEQSPATVKIRVGSYGEYFLGVYNAGFAAGSLQIDGRKYLVAISDANFNGRYGDTISGAWQSHDTLGIDLDGNRTITRYDDSEMMPLPKLLAVGGVYYELEVAADGSEVSARRVEPAMASLSLPPGVSEAVLWSDSGVHTIRRGGGPYVLPSGVCGLKSVTLTKTDARGRSWNAVAQDFSGGLENMDLAGGDEVELAVGEPLVLKSTVRMYDRTANLGVQLVGRGGEVYGIALNVGIKTTPAPKFEIFDDAGEVLESGEFEFG